MKGEALLINENSAGSEATILKGIKTPLKIPKDRQERIKRKVMFFFSFFRKAIALHAHLLMNRIIKGIKRIKREIKTAARVNEE